MLVGWVCFVGCGFWWFVVLVVCICLGGCVVLWLWLSVLVVWMVLRLFG